MSVHVDVAQRVLIVTIDRPERRNAIDHQTALEISKALDRAETDDGIGAVVITGAGDDVFCAGFDLTQAGQQENAFIDGTGFAGVCEREFKKPIIAAVNGLALGGGFEIVLACHLVVASRSATFGLPEVKVGGLAGAGGLIRLPRVVAMPIALEILLTGDSISAERAAALGLVNHVTDGHPSDAAIELATKIASNAPVAVRVCLDAATKMREGSLDNAWTLNDVAVKTVTASEDMQEGVAAFREKRRPVWRGR